MTDHTFSRAERIVLTIWVVLLTVGSAMAVAKHYEIRRIEIRQEVRK